MTTTDVARQLEVSGEFVRGEIRAQRLHASVIQRPGKRVVYRITREQFTTYIAEYWRPDVPRATTSQRNQ